MLSIYRRHQKRCPHLFKGRKYFRCPCPAWVDGRMNGRRLHRALGTTDWKTAQQIVRNWETADDFTPSRQKTERITLERAWVLFLLDLEARKLQHTTVRKYRLLQKQMLEFAERRGQRFLVEFDLEKLDEFRSTWSDGALSASMKLERLRAFFRFAYKRKWITENATIELRSPKISLQPTMPFTAEETQKALAAVDRYVQATSASGRENGRRLRALVLLLRYSGMRISDVVNLAVDRISGNRLFLYTQKTGVPVHMVLPEFVVSVLEATPRRTDKYFFWSGIGKLDSAVRSWQTRLRKLFEMANISGGHAHRFRDTFGVELLLAGIPIERVSVLLGHQSVRVTEKHYNPWVRSRQEQLEADLERAWSRDPLVVLETEVARRVPREPEAVN